MYWFILRLFDHSMHSEVEKSEWVHLGAGLVPSGLRYHAVSERVVSFLEPPIQYL